MPNESISISIDGAIKAGFNSLFSDDNISLPVMANNSNVGEIIFEKSQSDYCNAVFYTNSGIFSKYNSGYGGLKIRDISGQSFSNTCDLLKKMLLTPKEPHDHDPLGDEKYVSKYIHAIVKNNGNQDCEEIKQINIDRNNRIRREDMVSNVLSILYRKNSNNCRSQPLNDVIIGDDLTHKLFAFRFDIHQAIDAHEKSHGKIESFKELKSLVENDKISNLPTHEKLNPPKVNKKTKTSNDHGMSL